MGNSTKNKICPRCTGNGYIRIPNEAVGNPKEIIAQCTMCDSQGELDDEGNILYFGSDDLHKLQ
jgi:DnaJ-class molecular chaperone